MAWSGKYKPENPSKYEGDSAKIVWRSSWELKFMKYADLNPKIVKWSSEEIVIPYICKTDNKKHRYFMDFCIKFYNREGKLETTLIEVKPFSKVQMPKKKQRNTKRYLKEVAEYMKNTSKWEEAGRYASERGWNFKIFTEYELGIKSRK